MYRLTSQNNENICFKCFGVVQKYFNAQSNLSILIWIVHPTHNEIPPRLSKFPVIFHEEDGEYFLE